MNKARLDTDTLSELFKGVNPAVARNATAYCQAFGHYTLSAITVMDVVAGLHRVQSPRRIQKFMSDISGEEVLAFDQDDGKLASEIAVDLERTGQTIGWADPMIAAIAIGITEKDTTMFFRTTYLLHQVMLRLKQDEFKLQLKNDVEIDITLFNCEVGKHVAAAVVNRRVVAHGFLSSRGLWLFEVFGRRLQTGLHEVDVVLGRSSMPFLDFF